MSELSLAAKNAKIAKGEWKKCRLGVFNAEAQGRWGAECAEMATADFETLFKGLLEPKRLLDVVKNFICLSGKGPGSVPGHSWPGANKILAGYHQYFAVRKAIKKTKQAMRGDGRSRYL